MRSLLQTSGAKPGRVQCLACALALILLLFGDVIFLRASLAPIDYSDVLARAHSPRTVTWLPERAGRTILNGQGDVGAAAYQLQPAVRFMAFCMRHGQSPYWDPYIATGALGPEALVDIKFSPFVLVTAIFGGGSSAFSFVLVALYLWSAYCLLRALTFHLDFSLAAAFASTALFFLNGFALSNLYTQMGQPYFLAPVLLLSLLILTGRPGLATFATAVGAHVLFFATTFFPTLVLTAIVVYAFTLSLRISERPAHWRSILLLHVAPALSAVLLLGFLYVPIFAAYLTYLDTFAVYAARKTPGVSLLNLISLFTPKHIWESYSATRYPVPPANDAYEPLIDHIGIVGPLIAIHAFSVLTRRTAWPICCLGMCVLAAFGQIFGIFPFTLLDSLPFFSFVRNTYWPAMLVFALVLLTAYGFDAIRAGRSFTIPCAVLMTIMVCALWAMHVHVRHLRAAGAPSPDSAGAGSIMLAIDAPGPQAEPLHGSVEFGGWAIATNVAISKISLAVDGSFVANAAYGAGRNDVCRIYPGRPGCPNVGWDALVDTTQFANGAHTLSVTAYAGAIHASQNRQFRVSNPWAPAYVAVFFGVLAAIGVFLIAARRPEWNRCATSAVIALLVFEGVFYMNNLRPYRSGRDQHLPTAIAWLKRQVEHKPGSRILNIGVTGVPPNWGSALQIPQLGNLNSGELPWYRTFFYRYIGSGLFLSLDNQNSTLSFTDSSLSLAGVRYVVVDKSLQDAVARLSGMGFAIVQQDAIRDIFENPNAMPRAFIVHNWTKSDKLPVDVKTTITTQNQDLLSELGAPKNGAKDPQPVQLVSYSNTLVRLRCLLTDSGALLLADSWSPDWKAKVDGRQIHMTRADAAFRAVPLTAGTHEIVFHYESASLKGGIALTLAAMLGLITGALILRSIRGQSKMSRSVL